MASSTPPPVTVRLTYSDPRLDDAEREALAVDLYHQLRAPDTDFGEVRRVVETAPAGAKSLAAQVVGALAAVVSAASLKAFFAHLSERWRGREITVEITIEGKAIKLTARSAEDLNAAYNAAALLLAAAR